MGDNLTYRLCTFFLLGFAFFFGLLCTQCLTFFTISNSVMTIQKAKVFAIMTIIIVNIIHPSTQDVKSDMLGVLWMTANPIKMPTTMIRSMGSVSLENTDHRGQAYIK